MAQRQAERKDRRSLEYPEGVWGPEGRRRKSEANFNLRNPPELSTDNDIHPGDCVQPIDHTWLHLINGSNYAKIPGKEQLVNKMIDNIDKLYAAVKEEK